MTLPLARSSVKMWIAAVRIVGAVPVGLKDERAGQARRERRCSRGHGGRTSAPTASRRTEELDEIGHVSAMTENTETVSVSSVLHPCSQFRRAPGAGAGLANREVRESAEHAEGRAPSRPPPRGQVRPSSASSEYAPGPVSASAAAPPSRAAAASMPLFCANRPCCQCTVAIATIITDDDQRRAERPEQAERHQQCRRRSPCRPPPRRRSGRAGSPAVRRTRRCRRGRSRRTSRTASACRARPSTVQHHPSEQQSSVHDQSLSICSNYTKYSQYKSNSN